MSFFFEAYMAKEEEKEAEHLTKLDPKCGKTTSLLGSLALLEFGETDQGVSILFFPIACRRSAFHPAHAKEALVVAYFAQSD